MKFLYIMFQDIATEEAQANLQHSIACLSELGEKSITVASDAELQVELPESVAIESLGIEEYNPQFRYQTILKILQAHPNHTFLWPHIYMTKRELDRLKNTKADLHVWGIKPDMALLEYRPLMLHYLDVENIPPSCRVSNESLDLGVIKASAKCIRTFLAWYEARIQELKETSLYKSQAKFTNIAYDKFLVELGLLGVCRLNHLTVGYIYK